MDVFKSDSLLIVYLDVKSPYALISVKPTLALQLGLGLMFDYRPYTLDMSSYLGSTRKDRKGGNGRVDWVKGCSIIPKTMRSD